MRVFLTGSSGQVGGAIATALLDSGFEVVGAWRSRLPVASSETVQVELGRAGAVGEIRSAIAPCGAIVHAAASLSLDPFDPTIPLTNCVGTQQITELAELWAVHTIINISSVPVVGEPPHEAITEELLPKPRSVYHASKLFGEHLVRLAQREDRSAMSLRITSPVGAGTPIGRIFGTFVRQAAAGQPLIVFGAGTRRQNYVDVRDIAIAVAENLGGRVNGIYNIGGARSVSDLELARMCVDVLGSHSHIEFSETTNADDADVWNVSIAKARRDLGFQPRFTLADSIRDLAAR